jgi:hypothetical protein
MPGTCFDSTIGTRYALYHGDSVLALPGLPDKTIGLSVSSWPFSDQYAYSPSINDFGNCDDDDDFFAQCDYLLPELLRVTIPGRFAIVHCKDRIIYGSRNGGVRMIEPFSDKVTAAMRKHGWLFYGRITIATDPVRENNQTNNLPYSELQKDASRYGVGMPEYLLLFRRPFTLTAEGGQWSDDRVALSADAYSLPRWQLDANSLWRSSGERQRMPWEEGGRWQLKWDDLNFVIELFLLKLGQFFRCHLQKDGCFQNRHVQYKLWLNLIDGGHFVIH